MSPFSELQQELLRVLITIASCMSILSSLFIALSYLLYPNLRSFPYKLIVYLTLCDAASCLAYFVPFVGVSPHLCYAQAATLQFFGIASVLWTGCFGFNIYQVLVRGNSTVDRWELYYHAFVWGISLFLLLINILLDSFSLGILWCWIGNDFMYLRFLTFYGPWLGTTIFNGVLYLSITHSLSNQIDIQGRLVNIRLIQYITVFVFGHMWGFINRTQNWCSPNEPIFGLYIMHAIFSPLQGALDSFLYGANHEFRRHYYQIFRVNFSCAEKMSHSDTMYREYYDHTKIPSVLDHDPRPEITPTKSPFYSEITPAKSPFYFEKDTPHKESLFSTINGGSNKVPVVVGYLTNKGEIQPFWKRRYFIIQENMLMYSQERTLENANKVSLRNSIVRVPDAGEDTATVFQLETSGQIYFLQAANHDEQQRWILGVKMAADSEHKMPMNKRSSSPAPGSNSGSKVESRTSPIMSYSLNDNAQTLTSTIVKSPLSPVTTIYQNGIVVPRVGRSLSYPKARSENQVTKSRKRAKNALRCVRTLP